MSVNTVNVTIAKGARARVTNHTSSEPTVRFAGPIVTTCQVGTLVYLDGYSPVTLCAAQQEPKNGAVFTVPVETLYSKIADPVGIPEHLRVSLDFTFEPDTQITIPNGTVVWLNKVQVKLMQDTVATLGPKCSSFSASSSGC